MLVAVVFFSSGAILLPDNIDLHSIKMPFLSITPTPSSPLLVQVTRVIDGDTVEIGNGVKLRYIGIDTPETKHPSKGIQCFGEEAWKKNKELVEHKYVKLEKDISETDRYGRLLRYVWVFDSPSATGEGIFVNEVLVRNGYAHASTYPPDVKYADLFLEAQNDARKNSAGLWEKCLQN